MVLATWLLPLLWFWARIGHQASQFWSRLQHFPYAQLFHSSPYLPSFNLRPCAAYPSTTTRVHSRWVRRAMRCLRCERYAA